eukprot:4043499-Prymnesium_polylepis.2
MSRSGIAAVRDIRSSTPRDSATEDPQPEPSRDPKAALASRLYAFGTAEAEPTALPTTAAQRPISQQGARAAGVLGTQSMPRAQSAALLRQLPSSSSAAKLRSQGLGGGSGVQSQPALHQKKHLPRARLHLAPTPESTHLISSASAGSLS